MPERGLFRWAGAKRHLIERIEPLIRAHVSATAGRLISLFAGSLAIERAVGGAAVAADASPELLGLYEDLQQAGAQAVHAETVRLASATPATQEGYEALRELISLPKVTRSARFLTLSCWAFNGIWRVNSHGVMNMPRDPERLALGVGALPPVEAFENFAAEIRGTQFVVGWERALAQAVAGDLLLVDPPYGKFSGYVADGFDSRDHRLLASALKEAVIGGVGLIGFNAPSAASIYYWAQVEEVERSGAISCKPDERDPVKEIIITADLRGTP